MEGTQDIIVDIDDNASAVLDVDKAADDIGNIHLLDETLGEEDGPPVATDMDTTSLDWAANVSTEHRLNKTTTELENDLETRSAGGADKAVIVATCATESESQEHSGGLAQSPQLFHQGCLKRSVY